jgi:hypothetical protein
MSVICISSKHSRRIRGDLFRHRFDRVVHAGLARLVQGGLNLLHEGVEMHAALGLDADMGEEQVHQHGLAPPNAAPEIQTLLSRGFRPAEARQQALALRRLQLFAQLLQPEERGALHGIGAQHPLGHAGVIDRLQMLTHGAFLASFPRRLPPGIRHISST